MVADGTYTGEGNKDLSSKYKSITVKSENGPTNCIIDCEGDGRAFDIRGGSPTVSGFTITNGRAINGGGIWWTASGMITNCIIVGNSADDNSPYNGYGGGVYCPGGASPTISNCLILNNSGKLGGGIAIFSSSGSPTITNCTITQNSAIIGGGIFTYNLSSMPTVENSILWENTADYGLQIALRTTSNPSSLSVRYCDVQEGETGAFVEAGCSLSWGEGNMDINPLFVADFHLTAGSPCRNTAYPGSVPPGFPENDIDGETRPEGLRYDLGADEFVDSDSDNMPDYWEFQLVNADPDDYIDTIEDVLSVDDFDSDGEANLVEFENATNPTNPMSAQRGDVDGDKYITLDDAIMALQVMSYVDPGTDISVYGDVNGDKKIGIEEVIYILQKVSKVR